MSSDSATVPAVVPAVVPAEPPAPVNPVDPVVTVVSVEAVVAVPEVKAVVETVINAATAAAKDPVIADDLKELLKVLQDKLQKKPENKAEMAKLYHDVTMQLSTYLVKQLPPMEQKAALMALWAVEQVETASVGCFGLRK
jgi:thioredoxin-like negative regulator of GroEL